MPVQETQETCVRSLGWKDTLEKEMEAHSNILAWKIPWTEEPGRTEVTVHGVTESDITEHPHKHSHRDKDGPVVKNLPVIAGDTGLIPGLGRSHMPWGN